MNFLSIDCSTNLNFLFLKYKNKTFFHDLQSSNYNNDSLMKIILDFFKKSQLRFKDIQYIYVNQGPGQFSSLRGSISTAKGICISHNLSLLGYTSFLLFASNYYEYKKPFSCLVNFNNRYVIQNFNKNLKKTSKPKIIEKGKLLDECKKKFIIIDKNSINLINQNILNKLNFKKATFDPSKLEFLREKQLINRKFIRPLYLN